MSSELRRTINAYNADPDGYRQRYEQVDVASHRRFFSSYLPTGGRILDAGCGTGRDVAAFSKAGFDVDGIDLSSELLQVAAENWDGPSSSIFTTGDIRFMPFDDDAYDGVWAMASLVHMWHSGVEEALAEIRRVLKPGGWLFVTLKASESDEGRWDGDRWFSFWTLDSAHSAFRTSGFIARSVEIDKGSIGGDWINALLHKPA